MKNFDDSDIKNLNSEISHSKEETERVRKMFLLLLSFFAIVIILFVIYFMYQEDFIKILKKDENITKQNQSKKVVENTKSKEKQLYELENGELDVNNAQINKLFNIFYYDIYDYFIIDSSKIYKTSFNNLTNREKLFFISKTDLFYDSINKNGKRYNNVDSLCAKPIIISEKEIETIALKKFNLKNIDNTDFLMTYLNENIYISYLYFKYVDGNYIGTCYENKNNYSSIVARNIISHAEKDNDYIYIYIKSIFENKNGVYRDVYLKNKISSEYNKDEALSIYQKGSVYKLYFKYNDDKDYYFEKMELID